MAARTVRDFSCYPLRSEHIRLLLFEVREIASLTIGFRLDEPGSTAYNASLCEAASKPASQKGALVTSCSCRVFNTNVEITSVSTYGNSWLRSGRRDPTGNYISVWGGCPLGSIVLGHCACDQPRDAPLVSARTAHVPCIFWCGGGWSHAQRARVARRR
jgi:hypothetical protein